MKKNTNKAAVSCLRAVGRHLSAESIVVDLIEGGIIEADEISDAEHFAECARSWISSEPDPHLVFNNAKGWNTEGWAVVTGEDLKLPQRRSIVFDALVILAKESGVEL